MTSTFVNMMYSLNSSKLN